jgi:NADH-quinone oxidoreductase subunit L
VVLAIGSIVGGYIDIPDFVAPAFRLEEGAHEAHHAGWLPIVATLAALTGIGIAVYMFLLRTELPQRIYARARGVARILEAKYGFDLLYDWIAARVIVEGSERVLWRGLDVRVIDAAVNGLAAVTAAAARSVRVVQTGLVRAYALMILGGAVALVSYLLWVR